MTRLFVDKKAFLKEYWGLNCINTGVVGYKSFIHIIFLFFSFFSHIINVQTLKQVFALVVFKFNKLQYVSTLSFYMIDINS